jgi:hypothetical protein
MVIGRPDDEGQDAECQAVKLPGCAATGLPHTPVAAQLDLLPTTMKRLSLLAKATRTTLSFPDTEAQYIRLTYLDHHAQLAGNFPNTFAFTTEVEAYRTK